jgi:hypothetical protein
MPSANTKQVQPSPITVDRTQTIYPIAKYGQKLAHRLAKQLAKNETERGDHHGHG